MLATDIDTRHLEWIRAPNIEIRTHDILAGGLGSDGFDVAHCRGLLEHLADPDCAIDRMVAALSKGAWLLVEGADFDRYRSVDHEHPLADVFDTTMRKLFSFIRTTGTFDPFIGPSLAERLQSVGLEEIRIDDTGMVIRGGGPMAVMFDISWQRFDPVLTAHGVLTDSEIAGRNVVFRDELFEFSYGGIARRHAVPADATAVTTPVSITPVQGPSIADGKDDLEWGPDMGRSLLVCLGGWLMPLRTSSQGYGGWDPGRRGS